MIYYIKIILTTIFLILLTSNIYGQKNKTGYALLTLKVYDTLHSKYISIPVIPDFKVWYKGNYSIRQQDFVNIVEDNEGNSIVNVYPNMYYFIDIKRRIFYEYCEFNTKNIFYRAYLVSDTMLERSTGTVFWGYPKNLDSTEQIIIPIESLKPMSDTLIENTRYIRMFAKTFPKNNLNNDSTLSIYYFRPDVKGSPLNIVWNTAKYFEYPLVCIESFSKPPYSSIVQYIQFIRFKLTKQEKKIFRVWKKHARKYRNQIIRNRTLNTY